MKEIWNKIKNIDDSVFLKYKNVIFKILFAVIFLLIAICCFQRCSIRNMERNENILSQNVLAMSSENEKLKNENGNYYTKQKTLALNIKELERVNSDLAKEVKSYKQKIAVISKINVDVAKTDTVTIFSKDTVIIRDSNFVTHKIDWWHKDETLKFKGYSIFNMAQDSIYRLESKLTDYSINILLYTGLMKDKDGVFSVYARTDNPNVTFDIESNISPDIFYQKKKNWGVGFFVGPSVNFNLLENKNINAGFAVGIGISYNLFNF